MRDVHLFGAQRDLSSCLAICLFGLLMLIVTICELAAAERGIMMTQAKIFLMPFKTLYPLYLNKVTKKGRAEAELNDVIEWLTGYKPTDLSNEAVADKTLQQFFETAPSLNPNRKLITGVICGVRVEDITEPLLQEIRYLDKLVDELAKGKPLSSIMR